MSRANALLVLLKGGAIVLFLALGGALVRPANWHPFAPGGFSGAISVGVAVVFAFVGFDAVSLAAEEARDPERDLPAGILGSIGISTAAYVSVTLVVLGIIPYTAFHSAPWGRSGAAAYALKAVGAGPLVQAAVSAGMLIGMLSLMLVLQFGQSRIWYAMARDRLLPPVFASLHPESHSPRRCAWISGAALAVTAGLVTIGDSGDLAAFGALAAFAIAPICVIALRRSQPERARCFKAPWSPWLPLIALVCVVVILLTLPRLVWVRFAIWLVIGLAIYFGYGMRKSATPHRCA